MEDEGSKKGIGYSLLYALVYILALLPFRILYILSDILYLVVYHVARYRRKLVRKNLKNTFPEKTEKSIEKIEKKFYRHLCDYFVETIKTLRLSDEEMRKRMKFENPEIIERLISNGKSCIVSLGHYGNWEWVTSIGLQLTSDTELGLVYKKLHSRASDYLFRRIRSHFGAIPIEMKNVIRQMIRLQDQEEVMVIGFLSDQRPGPRQEKYWTTFLNQQTPVQVGMEKIARRLGNSVVYLDIEKVKRGYYVGKLFLISADASEEAEFSIIEKYMRKLEETTLREPAYYLWSHNRWKFKKPEN
ncbi:lysophospholipid acyltransferase family protein [Proteiniphilum sp.]|uniref:lysophospholipid acyltransferase family protein n=1 Tax=Proteiniphilum sp. TaxID=1926877 RepID=UPI002B20F687|nr:lysophospholipid acyltransferase family protein [Proteiniphilum sp.]MEA4919227.1 lysophospholipid acyltransferase family protein [Proteiniphilum sp.]